MLLFKDLVKLFASYNDGIINLLGSRSQSISWVQLFQNGSRGSRADIEQDSVLCVAEKYFKMKKSDCKEALEIYKRFLTRVTKIGEFMKLAEVGWGFGDACCRVVLNLFAWIVLLYLTS